jgi:hypothetical protein
MKIDKERVENAWAGLREILQPGDTVYSVLRHVSASGMQRRIDFYVIKDNRPRYLSGYMEAIGLGRLSKKGGLVVNGYGMDMGFHIAYNLSRMVFKNDGQTDPGYRLNHEWI